MQITEMTYFNPSESMSKGRYIIMCRGNSLSRQGELVKRDSDTYVLVNQWDAQLEMPEFQFLAGKEIQHYINREPHNVLKEENYLKYGITRVVLNVSDHDRRSSIVAKVASKRGVEGVEGMPDKISRWASDGKYSFPSMGVQTLVHVAICREPREIAVVGMDFFEDDYYTYHSSMGGRQVRDYQKKKNSNMKPYVVDFVKNNSHIEFTFVTNATFMKNSVPTNMSIL